VQRPTARTQRANSSSTSADPAFVAPFELARGLREAFTMDADLARMTLLSQHDGIRGSLDRCALLATRFRDGEHVAEELETAVQALRREVEVHIETENALINVLLLRGERWGVQLIERMIVEHLAEHAAMWALLTGSINDVAPRIGELAEELDAHMAAEERTFLAPHVLRADVIERHRP